MLLLGYEKEKFFKNRPHNSMHNLGNSTDSPALNQESAKRSRIFIRFLLHTVSALGDPLVHFLLMFIKHLVQIEFRGMNQLSVALRRPSVLDIPNAV